MQHNIDLKELNFDLYTPRVGGLGSESKIFTTELLHLRFSFLIWDATWPCSEKGWTLNLLIPSPGSWIGAAVKIFGTMLMHSWLQLIWYATWPWRNSQIHLFNICPGCSKVPSPRRWPSWASMTFFFHCKQENRPPTRQTGETISSINFNLNTCFGCSKEPSQLGDPPEHPQHVFNHKY